MTQKPKHRLRNNTFFTALCVWATLATPVLTPVANALPEDTQQEIHISSDQATLDRQKGEVVYQGNVVVTQGTLNISADKVTLVRTNTGLEKVIAMGNPARYEQVISLNEDKTIAYGKTIIYHTTTEQLTLLDDAGLTKAGNEFNGEKIIYYIKDQRVLAEGQSEEKSDGRIKMVIQPQASTPPNQAQQNNVPQATAPADVQQ